MVVEWAPFSLRQGADENGLLAASENMEKEFLSRQPGYVRRELLKSEDGYVDIVWWATMSQAKAAMAKAPESAACARYFEQMQLDEANPETGILHFSIVQRFRRS